MFLSSYHSETVIILWLSYLVFLVESGVVGTVADRPLVKAGLVHADRLLDQSVEGKRRRFLHA